MAPFQFPTAVKVAEKILMTAEVTLSVSLGGFLILELYLYEVLMLQPKRLRSKLEKQGIKGPPPSSILLGNIPEINKIKLEVTKKPEAKDQPLTIAHDWPSNHYPHLAQWRKEYGPIFMYSTGSIQFLIDTEIEMVKQIIMYVHIFDTRKASLSVERFEASNRRRHYLFKWPYLVTPEENYFS